jgi:hypothetical protein
VRGVAGGETGIILQDTAIRRMSYVPGSPVIFQIERISQDKGLFGPYSIIRAGERIFFYSTQVFIASIPAAFRPDRPGTGRPHVLCRSRPQQSAALHRRRRPAQFAGVLGLQIRQRHRQPVRQDPGL